MKTSFQLVSEMNTAFGNPKGDPLNINWQKVQKQFLNVPDEVGELFIALGGHEKGSDAEQFIKASVAQFKKDLVASLGMGSGSDPDLKTVRDSSRDIVVFTDGGNHLMGIDADRDMQTVIQGVMTRFIKDDADKAATIAKHAANGITEVYFEGSYPTMVMKSAVDQPDAPKGKFLKSASYREFEFYDVRAHAALDVETDDEETEDGYYPDDLPDDEDRGDSDVRSGADDTEHLLGSKDNAEHLRQSVEQLRGHVSSFTASTVVSEGMAENTPSACDPERSQGDVATEEPDDSAPDNSYSLAP